MAYNKINGYGCFPLFQKEFAMFSSLICVLLASPVSPQALNVPPKIVLEEVADISGYYVCKGLEGSGKPYAGIAVIAKKGEIYIVTWVIGGASTFTGIGLRQGNNLAVSWAIASDKGLVRGVNSYRIEIGPRLTGRGATLPGNGVLQSETLTFLKNLDED